MRRSLFGGRAGFTLVELLVVIAIIGVLIALLLPAIQKVRDASQRTQCQSNMRQVGIALHTSQDANGLMPSYNPTNGTSGYPWPGNLTAPATWTRGSVHFYLLPFLDQTTMMQLWLTQTASEGLIGQKPPKVFLCPTDPSGTDQLGNNAGFGISNYVSNGQFFIPDANGIAKIPSGCPDGASTTAMMFERYGACGAVNVAPNWSTVGPPGSALLQSAGGPWTATGYSKIWNTTNSWANDANAFNCSVVYFRTDGWINMVGTAARGATGPFNKNTNQWKPFQAQPNVTQNCDYSVPQSIHTSGLNVLMGDASVHLVAATVSVSTFSASITPNSGDVVGPDW
jgi:prepilin-type N-terminal cleavage/methylation domain-containing protein